MKSHLLSLLCLLFFAFAANAAEENIVGVWVQTKGPDDHFYFKKDGSFIAFNMVEGKKLIGFSGTFTVSGNLLTLIISESANCKIKPQEQHKINFDISGDILHFTASGKIVSSYKKVKDKKIINSPLSPRNFPPK